MKLLAVLYAVTFAALVAASRVQEASQDENTNLNCVEDDRGRLHCCPEGESWPGGKHCLCSCMDVNGCVCD
ncbi:hypothetical protein BDW42DRAFT_172901 [Aspergillus taichungensis]|uniref:Uncharacterized protein n=1 Tax=Aspergillus taichungensis TaxID=482145 RepID=A0A2J5HQE1_9EURO|nr:hypothetical protein BDW42DRAFT_172901 [Aspergillus taichungensis]